MYYLLLLQHFREACGGILDNFMLQITSLADALPTFLLLSFIYWCADKEMGIYIAGNVGLSCTFSQYFKWLFRIDRPWVQDTRIVPVQAALSSAGGYSFPSGHTVRTSATWGAMGTYSRRQNKHLWYIGWLVVLLVAFSRNYLGVHTFWDILGALVLSILSMFLLTKALQWERGGKNRDIVLCIVGCSVCFLPMLQAGCLSNAGAAFGMWCGWFLEKRFIKFKPCRDLKEKVVRFAVGAFGILFIHTAFRDFLNLWMLSKYSGFFMMFAQMLFILALYPFLFSKCSDLNKKHCLPGVLGLVIMLVLVGTMAVGKIRENANVESETELMVTESVGETVEEVSNPAGDTISDAGDAMSDADTPETQPDMETASSPVVIAHRGYSSQFPENTLISFAGAVDVGADMIELDVQLSKDGFIMVYHDGDLSKLGLSGSVADYSYEELCAIDVGSAFGGEYVGERMPTLSEVLELIRETELGIYLELKDIGDVQGFEEAVLGATDSYAMTDRCVFASFNYQYLQHLKEMNPQVSILYNVSVYDAALPQQFEAEYYGLNIRNISREVVEAIHSCGRKAYVWTVNTPGEIVAMRDLGADGIVTNYAGIARVVVESPYSFLAERYARSFALPGLYGQVLPEECADAVVQGMTYADGYILISAYRKSGSNSLLYVLDSAGKWLTTIDIGFSAHTGGIAYDNVHNLLWVTAASGSVCALDWSEVKECFGVGSKGDVVPGPQVVFSFDAELVNHNGSKVASFLDMAKGKLYVGSYVIGSEGILRGYDITDPAEPKLVTKQWLPEKIQGMTTIAGTHGDYLLLSQSAETDDSALLVFLYDEQTEGYTEVIQSYVLPEGAEQLEAMGDKLMILFESAARPYQETARIRNDQVYVVDMKKWLWE